jgi:hypothetical protein
MEFKLKNFTVEAFNRDVNSSGDLARKYNAWSGYRAQVSALIGEAITLAPQTDRVLVLAAGNLNDIDLCFLLKRLKSLTLSDADLDAMERGINRQNLSEAERAKITLEQSDYSGARQVGFFDELEARARDQASAQALADHIQTALSKLDSLPVPAVARPFPLVISCPVYTQLLYTQIEVFLQLLFEAGLYTYDDLNVILNAAYGAMPGVLTHYNAMLLNVCAPGGLIVLLSDMIEMELDSRAYREVFEAAKDGVLTAREAEALIECYGSELAQIGLRDFLSKTQTLTQRHMLWPFGDGKAYLVCGCLAKNEARGRRP